MQTVLISYGLQETDKLQSFCLFTLHSIFNNLAMKFAPDFLKMQYLQCCKWFSLPKQS